MTREEERRKKRNKLVDIKIDNSNLSITLSKTLTGLMDLSKSFEEFHTEMVKRIDRTFDLAGGPGSAEKGGYDPFRDIRWEPFAVQRERENGTAIPAWGDIARVDGGGKVKGRLRPSGKRVTKASRLNQDTGRFRQRAATGYVRISRASLTFGPDLNYATWVQEKRPAVIVTEKDGELLEKIIYENILGDDKK